MCAQSVDADSRAASSVSTASGPSSAARSAVRDLIVPNGTGVTSGRAAGSKPGSARSPAPPGPAPERRWLAYLRVLGYAFRLIEGSMNWLVTMSDGFSPVRVCLPSLA